MLLIWYFLFLFAANKSSATLQCAYLKNQLWYAFQSGRTSWVLVKVSSDQYHTEQIKNVITQSHSNNNFKKTIGATVCHFHNNWGNFMALLFKK
jgi:hypothetical protein